MFKFYLLLKINVTIKIIYAGHFKLMNIGHIISQS